LREKDDRWRVSLFGDRLHVITDGEAEAAKKDTIVKLNAAGIQVRDAYEEQYSLEDVFIGVVEKARKEGKVAKEE
jgi:ABC-2 type transport system ATP-binding protein